MAEMNRIKRKKYENHIRNPQKETNESMKMRSPQQRNLYY